MTENAIVPVANNFLAPAATVGDVLRVYQAKKDFIKAVLVEGVDFGKIPGTGDKPALLKPGAEKLSNFFSLYPTFEDIEKIEDWTGQDHGGEPLFYYRQRCNLWRLIDGQRVLVASADGSCNSWEKKYRYRQSERVCPNCGKPAIIKGKAEYGGGWLCFAKKGGCGAKFTDDAPEITEQQVGQVKNSDIFEQTNTILKMAQKRALVAASLIGTCASDYFTQDVEDYTDGEYKVSSPGQHQPSPDDQPPTQKALEALGDKMAEAAGMGIDIGPFEAAPRTTTGEARQVYKAVCDAIKAHK